jgi:hypothetical protein
MSVVLWDECNGEFCSKDCKAMNVKTEIMRCINCREKFEQKDS